MHTKVQRNASFVQRQRSSGVVSIMTSTKWSNRVHRARHITLPTRKNTDSTRRAKTCLAHSSYRSIPLEIRLQTNMHLQMLHALLYLETLLSQLDKASMYWMAGPWCTEYRGSGIQPTVTYVVITQNTSPEDMDIPLSCSTGTGRIFHEIWCSCTPHKWKSRPNSGFHTGYGQEV